MNQLKKFRNKSSALGARLFTALVMGMALAGPALATPAEFDPATVTAKITTYLGYGVVILGAMAVAVWTLRVFGLIGGRK